MNNKIQEIEKSCAGLDYEIFQDKVLMANASIGAQHYGIDLTQCAPTFILKVDDHYVAVIIQGSKKLDFKKVRKHLSAKTVTMATRDEILNLTGSPIGSVSMINTNLQTFDYCYGSCGAEKYTLKINPAHLIEITKAQVGEFTKNSQ